MMMFRNALLMGVSFGLAACGGGAGGPALVTTPPPVSAPTPEPTPPPAPAPTPTPTPTPAPSDTLVLTNKTLTVRQNGVDYYQSGDYITYPNNWYASDVLKLPDSEYSQTVEVRKLDFPNKTLISWQYPTTKIPDQIYGFPSIAWGKSTYGLTGDTTTGFITNIGNVGTFTEKYNVTLSGDTRYMNLFNDMFLYDSKGKVVVEIMYSTHPASKFENWRKPPDAIDYTENGHSYAIMVNPNTTGGWGSISIVPTDGSKITAGTVDWVKMFDVLIANKAVDPTWNFKGVELGVEVEAGSGSMLVNEFSVTFAVKNQQAAMMASTQAQQVSQATTTATQTTSAAVGQMIGAALANPQTPTYGFSQSNAGVGTNMRLSNRLTLGTSTVLAVNGYTFASRLAWNNKNIHALFMTGTGNQRINNTNTQSAFSLVNLGAKLPTRLASFEPYARLGYTRYNNANVDLTSTRLAGGMNALVPISRSLLLRMTGEVANEFNGKGMASASMSGVTALVPININGLEYTGSVNLSQRLSNNLYAQMAVGTRKNTIGTNNYANIGMVVPF